MHSITNWNLASRPNYVTNVDKVYPYSEVPYVGNYHLVRIPLNGLIELVDYWGEGRIEATHEISGFVDSYNVNHQYQLVSNGPDKDRKIPNRIPVISYTNCNTRSYIKENSVKTVTLMGAPINNSCAEDIARMVNMDVGKVIVYGFEDDNNSADIRNLNRELKDKCILHCPDYKLPESLDGLSLYDSHRVYLNATELSDELYKKINKTDYENSLIITRYFKENDKVDLISDVITKLLKEGNVNTMEYAYKLWNSDIKDIASNIFPTALKHIFNEDFVKIIDKRNMFALKLDSNVDVNNDRLALGDSTDKSSDKVQWKITPVWKNKHVYFKILNIEYGMILKLFATESQDDKTAKGVTPETNGNDTNVQWSLQPIKIDDDILFYIVNHEFNQRLVLNESVDSNGDKQLISVFANNSVVETQSQTYGWFVAPFE